MRTASWGFSWQYEVGTATHLNQLCGDKAGLAECLHAVEQHHSAAAPESEQQDYDCEHHFAAYRRHLAAQVQEQHHFAAQHSISGILLLRFRSLQAVVKVSLLSAIARVGNHAPCMVNANTNARLAMAKNRPLSDTFKQLIAVLRRTRMQSHALQSAFVH